MLRRVLALKAQVAKLLDPKSIAQLAIFLSALAVAQAYGVGEIIEAILVGLAWWAARWAGLLAVKDIVTSIIEAGTAQRLPAIDEAAGRFARALLVLGLVFLSKLIERAGDEENVSGFPEPQPKEPPALPSRVGQALKSDSEASLQAARRTTAQDFYAQTGWPQARIDSHLSGIDFSQDVRVVELKQGDTVYQWVDPTRGVGQYFSPAGMTPDQLGISGDGRVLKSFTVLENTEVLQSTAAPVVDTWSGPTPVITSGGGTQWFALKKSILAQTGSP